MYFSPLIIYVNSLSLPPFYCAAFHHPSPELSLDLSMLTCVYCPTWACISKGTSLYLHSGLTWFCDLLVPSLPYSFAGWEHGMGVRERRKRISACRIVEVHDHVTLALLPTNLFIHFSTVFSSYLLIYSHTVGLGWLMLSLICSEPVLVLVNINEALTVFITAGSLPKSGLWADVRFPQGDRISTDVSLYKSIPICVSSFYISI